MDKKRLRKIAKKAKKDLINVKTNGKRSWLETNEDKKDYKKGKFNEEELQQIKKSICRYVKEHNLGKEGILNLVSKSTYEKKIWTEIAECLPNRSILSIYNAAKRKFNPNNY